MDGNKVVLGISGGVDSAAAAFILKEKGMDVYALYFDVIRGSSDDAKKRAESLANELNIPFRYVDLSSRFEKMIIDPFCRAYTLGCTPMPCIVCNPYIKWWVLKQYADQIGAKWIATGHYADIERIGDVSYVKKSLNTFKDQSYMLSRLGQDILSRIIFPLNNFSDKQQVKEYLNKHHISFPDSVKESQDICFIENDYRRFLDSKNITSRSGNFVDENGVFLGEHNGIHNYTIGQGKGFGRGFNKKVYVKEIDPENGNVVLSDNDALFSNKISISICSFAKYGEVNYIPEEYADCEFDVKIRYSAKPAKAVLKLSKEPGIAVLEFIEAQRAPTKGQYAVIYKNDIVIGCGIIS